ncbi:MAG: aroE [Deltaproteobacteria bacterium]|nr:aroE [Deltaproteobacteria bacterium]
MSDIKFFAVAGNPILHSRSPDMFRAAFKASSMKGIYLRFASSDAGDIARMVRNREVHGFNITSPYKEKILPFLDNIDEAACKSGAVNTVILRKGKLTGFNTDIDGVREALLRHGVEIRGKKALILGAGGAVVRLKRRRTSPGPFRAKRCPQRPYQRKWAVWIFSSPA